MNKMIKKCAAIISAAVLLVLSVPFSAAAVADDTSDFLTINKTNEFSYNDISLTDLKFKDLSDDYSYNFGISGKIINNGENENILTTVSYYTSDRTLICENTVNGNYTKGDESSFDQMTDSDTLGDYGYSIEDIEYYTITVAANTADAAAKPSEDSKYTYAYILDSYDVTIDVSENNTYTVTEKIEANFKQPKHGIYRTIPLKNEVVRNDGTTTTNRARISNVSVTGGNFSTSKGSDKYEIKIGSSDKTVTGTQDYVIKYTYDIGNDPCKGYDEFYYNIIGTEWDDTVIGNVTFTINMPKEFDSSKLGFTHGLYGYTQTDNISKTVTGTVITGSYNGVLNPGEALTTRLTLPDGYFIEKAPDMTGILVMYIMPGVFLVISFLLWFKYGKDNRVIKTVEFYPPFGLNSLETAFAYKGKVEDKDIVSLLIYLANKGYLQIIEKPKKNIFSQDAFVIKKLKPYDGNNENEAIFINGLFKNGSSHDYYSNNYNKYGSVSEEVTTTDLKNTFYVTVAEIRNNICCKKNKELLFEKNTKLKSLAVVLMIAITFVTMLLVPGSAVTSINDAISNMVFLLFFVPFFIVLFLPKVSMIFKIIWGSSLALIIGVLFCSKGLFSEIFAYSYYYVPFAYDVLCLIGMIVFLKLMPKRTPYGIEILGKIQGFKTFLNTAEKSKLEELVMQDPSYFYNVLPYTYVLGVSDKWIKQFENISVQPPTWYSGTGIFTVSAFSNCMTNTMNVATSAMTSSPSSGGGGSSGGGSSGGGSGGGGGGSW